MCRSVLREKRPCQLSAHEAPGPRSAALNLIVGARIRAGMPLTRIGESAASSPDFLKPAFRTPLGRLPEHSATVPLSGLHAGALPGRHVDTKATLQINFFESGIGDAHSEVKEAQDKERREARPPADTRTITRPPIPSCCERADAFLAPPAAMPACRRDVT